MSGVTDLLLGGAQAAVAAQLGRIPRDLRAALRPKHTEAAAGAVHVTSTSARRPDADRSAAARIRAARRSARGARRSLAARARCRRLARRAHERAICWPARIRAQDVGAGRSTRPRSCAPMRSSSRRCPNGRNTTALAGDAGAAAARRHVPVVTGFIGATADGRGDDARPRRQRLQRGDHRGGARCRRSLDLHRRRRRADGRSRASCPDARTLDTSRTSRCPSWPTSARRSCIPKTIAAGARTRHPAADQEHVQPDAPGHARRRQASDEAPAACVRGVTAIEQQSLVTIEGRGMLGVPGIAARAFGAVARTGTSVPMISQASSEQSICFVVPQIAAERACVDELRTGSSTNSCGSDIESIWTLDDGRGHGGGCGDPDRRPASPGRIFTARRRRRDQRASRSRWDRRSAASASSSTARTRRMRCGASTA